MGEMTKRKKSQKIRRKSIEGRLMGGNVRRKKQMDAERKKYNKKRKKPAPNQK